MNSSSFATEGIVVTLALLLLVWQALVQCRNAGIRLKMEQDWLASLDRALTTENRLDAQDARVLLDVWLEGTPKAKDAVTVLFLEQTLAGAEDVEANSVRQWISWPRYLAGIFVFIGLLGTVFSMSLALGKLGLTISDTSTAPNAGMTSQTGTRLLTGITGLLSGMESAFLCTLSGIVATLVVSLANWRYLRACDEFDQALQWMVLRRLSRQQDAAALSAATKSLAMVSDTAFRLSAKLLDVSTRFEVEANNISASYERAGKVLDKVNGIPLEKYEDLSRSSDALAEVARQLKEEHHYQEEGSETVQGAAGRMERAVTGLRDSLASSQKASSESLGELVGQVQKTNVTLAETVRRFELALNDVTAVVEATPVRQEMAALRAVLSAGQRAAAAGQNPMPSAAGQNPIPSNGRTLSPTTSVYTQSPMIAGPRTDASGPLKPTLQPAAPLSAWQRVRDWVGETASHLKR